jgi:hypothetical protein
MDANTTEAKPWIGSRDVIDRRLGRGKYETMSKGARGDINDGLKTSPAIKLAGNVSAVLLKSSWPYVQNSSIVTLQRFCVSMKKKLCTFTQLNTNQIFSGPSICRNLPQVLSDFLGSEYIATVMNTI